MLHPVSMLSVVLSALSTLSASTPLEERSNRPLVDCQGFDRAPGYNVIFKDPKYSVADHFKTIGQEFDYKPIPYLGYHAVLTDDQYKAADSDGNVDFVGYNCYGVRFDDTDTTVNGTSTPFSILPRATHSGAGYGLTYLSEKSKDPTDDTYYYPDSAGEGVDIYIIDSGIADIPPFKGRLVQGDDETERGHEDVVGHGTMVASCAASVDFGVAKKATIHNWQDGFDTTIEDWVVQASLGGIIKEDAIRKTKPGYKGAVINLSLGVGKSDSLEKLIKLAVDAGITVVAASGIHGVDASDTWPCAYTEVICVGAINQKYEQSSTSNWGKALTFYAPGDTINVFDRDGKKTTSSGTSLSAPFVAGIAALFYGVEGTKMNPRLVKERLMANAEIDILSGVKGDGPNVLANNGFQKASCGAPYIGGPPAQALDTCSYKYDFLFDAFAITGTNFNKDKLGTYGANLLSNLRRYGVVSGWTFEFTDNPPAGTQGNSWKAQGHLPIGDRSCIGKALLSSGGSSVDGCVGAG